VEKSSWFEPGFVNYIESIFGSGLSFIFVISLIVITLAFGIASFLSYRKSIKNVNSLKSTLLGITIDNIASKRRDIDQRLGELDDKHASIKHLWREFDETLIEVRKEGLIHLYNTFDASHFFNTHTLAKGVTENRLIAAVPGFLTAIGVIGTFIGLQIGLAELNISSDVSVDEMKTGVAGVIGGAKVAFLTSVWGVFLSVAFNAFEKVLDQKIRSKIAALQSQIDDIFPRLSPESQLQVIAENSIESRDSLQGLAEQIGVKMQESMLTATQGISDALESTLNEIMAPAINKLVDETSEGNQKALEELLTRFMDGFGEQGNQQRKAMEGASEKVNESIAGMNSTMNTFIQKLESSQAASGEREKELIATISTQVSQLVEQGDEQRLRMSELMEKQMSNLNSALEETHSRSQEREERATQLAEQRNSALEQQTASITNGTRQLMSQIETSVENSRVTSEQVIEQGKVLQKSVESSVLASAKATDSMRESASELKGAAEKMSVFGSHVREAGNKLSGAVTEAVETTKDLATQNLNASEKMENLRGQLLADTAEFKALADQINDMIVNAGDTFHNLKSSQSEYLSELKKNVSDLSTQMTQLLSDYAEQANSQTKDHLRVWADSSTQYASTMNSVANTLSGVVDEIQGKVSV